MSKENVKAPAPAKKARLGRGLDSLLGGGAFDDEDETPEPDPEVAPVPAAKKQADILKETLAKETAKMVQPSATTQPMPQPKPAAPAVPEHSRIWEVAIEEIVPNKNQPRKTFDAEPLEALSNSLKEKGLIQPITVRKVTEDGKRKFQIIAGERRWRAAQKAGLKSVPVILKTTTDQAALELALIENIQREDLNPIDEAIAYKFLLDEYQLTQQELAKRVGKERATIANLLRLLSLAPSVREAVKANQISLGQAKVLVSISDLQIQQQVAREVVKKGLTVRATEKLIAKVEKKGDVTAAAKDDKVSQKLIGGVSEELQKIIGTKVGINYSEGKGKVLIHFYSDDEFNEIVDQIRNKWHS